MAPYGFRKVPISPVLVVGIVVAVGGAIAALGVYAKSLSHATPTATPQTVKATDTPASTTSSSTPAASSYTAGQSYTDPRKLFSIVVPDRWAECTASGATASLESVCFSPNGTYASAVIVSVFNTSKSPKQWELDAEGANPPILEQSDITINGRAAYYQKYGDSTYTNAVYVIAGNGKVISIAMNLTVALPSLRPVDNSYFLSQFEDLAKSVRLF